ncbi:hypothetical protein GCM10017562_01800 [Streptomyces roseofulvus]
MATVRSAQGQTALVQATKDWTAERPGRHHDSAGGPLYVQGLNPSPGSCQAAPRLAGRRLAAYNPSTGRSVLFPGNVTDRVRHIRSLWGIT